MGDRDGRTAEELRRRGGAARTRPPGAPRLDLRLPRPQRRRQDDDDEDPPWHGPSERRQRARPRPSGGVAARQRRDPPPRRLRRRGERSLRIDDRRRDGPLHGRALPPQARPRGVPTKLSLPLALSRGAELLLLDEPTSGLDPAMAEEVLQALVGQVADEAVTVFFSSHQIAEVEQIADRVAIIDRGRAVVAGELDELRERFCRVRLVSAGDAPRPAFRAPGVERVDRNARVLTILSSRGSEPLVEEASALRPLSIDVDRVTLKEIFLDSAAAEE